MSDADTTQAEQAHEEYLAETRRLVDEHVTALFEMIDRSVARASGVAAGAQRAGVTRDNHALTVTNGGRGMVFAVEGITDLPEGSDRAQAFTTGQARCIVHAPDGTTTEWVLHRVGAGDATPPYTWINAATGTAITEDDLAALLQPLFA